MNYGYIGHWYNALVRDATIEALCMILKVKIKSELKQIDTPETKRQFEKKNLVGNNYNCIGVVLKTEIFFSFQIDITVMTKLYGNWQA